MPQSDEMDWLRDLNEDVWRARQNLRNRGVNLPYLENEPRQDNVRVDAYLPPALMADLRQFAIITHTPIRAVIRTAITEYLNGRTPTER